MAGLFPNKDDKKKSLLTDIIEDNDGRENLFEFELAYNTQLARTNIREKEDRYEISTDTPGFRLDQLKVMYDAGYIAIQGDAKEETEADVDKFTRKERLFGSFQRTFYVGAVASSQISAVYEDGLIIVTVPFAEGDEPDDAARRIDIDRKERV
ncbi:Hsp20/alpha crystallin family protein [Salisediminibacterium halotolerans]|uniref:Molecular chaperone IbpA, HSP20 family n=1 Tax=Salisediminibacterium halotolerans TaxID=517425 RepID=A0A1H9R7J9_9BACI|nr:Hsp20 family protein [Salisediminibacterium haloalkalitolerans]SER68660.1 Molecular chaperone IbpA, HSP20 family [Salisediminibacterium haloalkalitolerans]